MTEIEGLVVYAINTTDPTNKMELRNTVFTQKSKLVKIPGWESLCHPRLQQRIADAILFS